MSITMMSAICSAQRRLTGPSFRQAMIAGRSSEAWVDGHVHAFAFFGRVPVSVLSDNDKCLVARNLSDGTRQRTRLFSGFLSHYLIRDRYGRPGKGNE